MNPQQENKQLVIEPETVYHLDINGNTVGLLLKALSKLPYEEVASTIGMIQNQVAKQIEQNG